MNRKFWHPLKRIYRSVLGAASSPTHASYPEVERHERIFYINYLSQGMTVFDVGANVGELSLIFAQSVGPSGQVHAFEACTTTFEKLETLCGLTSHTNLVLNNTAISDEEGTVKLHIYDDTHSGWNTLAERPLQERGIAVEVADTEEVPATTIDRYCLDREIDHIDLMKIDVEGAEYQVLLGAEKMFTGKKIGCCVFEFGNTHFDMGNDPADLEDYLTRMGYRVENVVPNSPVLLKEAKANRTPFSVYAARPA